MADGVLAMTNVADSGGAVAPATYTRGEVAGLLGVSERHIDRMVVRKTIPGVLRMGRLVRFRRSVIDRWLSGDVPTGIADQEDAA